MADTSPKGEGVENNVEKGEIAYYEQFLLFPQHFQKTRENNGFFGKGLKPFTIQSHFLQVLGRRFLKSLWEKEKT